MTEPYILDERNGCVVVYRGPKQNCIAYMEVDGDDCVFFGMGMRDSRGSWTLPHSVLCDALRAKWAANAEDHIKAMHVPARVIDP